MTKTGLEFVQVHAVQCGSVRRCAVPHLIWHGVSLTSQKLLEAIAERGSAKLHSPREARWLANHSFVAASYLAALLELLRGYSNKAQ